MILQEVVDSAFKEATLKSNKNRVKVIGNILHYCIHSKREMQASAEFVDILDSRLNNSTDLIAVHDEWGKMVEEFTKRLREEIAS